MTLEQLRIFLAVARSQHMTRAAAALNLTQSAVSASVAALESRYDVRFFDRVGRRIQLTEAGRHFVDEARAILARVETAELSLADWSDQVMGRVRIHASQTVASYWLPPHLVRLRTLYPRVQVELTVGNTTQAAQALLQGEADIGVVEGLVDEPALKATKVADDELCLVVGIGHPWAGLSRIDARRYGETDWVLREPGSGTRARFEEHLASHDIALQGLSVLLEEPSNESILAAVMSSGAASVLSGRAVELAVAAGRVRAIAIPHMGRAFTALLHRERHHTRATRSLMDLLVARPADGSLHGVMR